MLSQSVLAKKKKFTKFLSFKFVGNLPRGKKISFEGSIKTIVLFVDISNNYSSFNFENSLLFVCFSISSVIETYIIKVNMGIT